MREEISKIVNGKYFDEWYSLVENILENKEFQKRIYFVHHKNKSVFEHSIKVSYDAYVFTINKNIDSKKCAIIGLLHDFYPYLWKNSNNINLLDEK